MFHTTRRTARGFTLIELLIAISLMLVLTLILTQIFNATADVFSRSQQQVQIYANEKGFVELLTRELANIMPPTGDNANSMRIYSPREVTRDSFTPDGDPVPPESFPYDTPSTASLPAYEDTYYRFDQQYGAGSWTQPFPDDIDLGSRSTIPYSAPSEEPNTKFGPPLLSFATVTTYVHDGERIIAPAWVEYFMAKTTLKNEGQTRLYIYLKRRLMRPYGFKEASELYGAAHWRGAAPGTGTTKEPYEKRALREELYEGSFYGDTVMEFFPRLSGESTEFRDLADAIKFEFLVFDSSAQNGKGAFAWIRPDERFGEAVFTISQDNPLVGGTPKATRPSRSVISNGTDANFYPQELLSEPNPAGGTNVYESQMPLAIRVTALLTHDKSSTTAVAREDYTSDRVPPRTFQHIFWLPMAQATLGIEGY